MHICLYDKGVGIKLPETSVKRLLKSDPYVIPYQPYEKVLIRDLVQVNLPNTEYHGYLLLFDEAIQYLQNQI